MTIKDIVQKKIDDYVSLNYGSDKCKPIFSLKIALLHDSFLTVKCEHLGRVSIGQLGFYDNVEYLIDSLFNKTM